MYAACNNYCPYSIQKNNYANQEYLEQLNHTPHELRKYCRKSPNMAILGWIAVV